MITEAAVRRALQEVIDPELGKNLVELDMVREITSRATTLRCISL